MVWCIRSWPADVNQRPEPTPAASPKLADMGALLSSSQILRNPNFWWLGLSLGLLLSSYSAILSNLTLYATQLGYNETYAARLIMVVAIGGVVGKLLFGFAADRFSKKAGLFVAQLSVFIGFLMLYYAPSYTLILVASLLLGLASGGMLPVWGALMANLFGLLSYGRAMGLIGPLVTLCVIPAYPLVGRLYDISGNFTLPLIVFCGMVIASGILLMPLRVRSPSQS